jgi:hypothetical protein
VLFCSKKIIHFYKELICYKNNNSHIQTNKKEGTIIQTRQPPHKAAFLPPIHPHPFVEKAVHLPFSIWISGIWSIKLLLSSVGLIRIRVQYRGGSPIPPKAWKNPDIILACPLVTPPSHPNRTIPSTLEKDLVRTQ